MTLGKSLAWGAWAVGYAKACSCVGICLVTQHPGTDNDRLEFDFEHFQPQGEGTESDRGLASNSHGQMLFENLRAVVVDHHQWSMTCFCKSRFSFVRIVILYKFGM